MHTVAMPMHYIFIGNPGNGKSTLLNILCNAAKFKGGYAVGAGLTTVHQRVTIGGITYTDTPGLNDPDEKQRKKSCEEISTALKNGGDYKVIFVVGEKNGRVLAEDSATMNMVLAAAPEIRMNKFGVIVNQVSAKTAALPAAGDVSKATWAAFLFSKRPDVSTGHLMFLPRIAELEDVSSESMNFGKVRGLSQIDAFIKFVTQCPVINLTPSNVTAIDYRQIAKFEAESKAQEEALKNCKAKIEELKKLIAANNKSGGFSWGKVAGAAVGFLAGGPLGSLIGMEACKE